MGFDVGELVGVSLVEVYATTLMHREEVLVA
jgi:hypothetical protein